MGMYDTVCIECINCGEKVNAQTKILGDCGLLNFEVGDKISNKEFYNCILELKDSCNKCHTKLNIKIGEGRIIKVTNENPDVVESSWGDYNWIGE